ncbi:MAG TPA: class I SAM-dependent methyltransferase [Mycobacterium sp.]|nr:class I SAM-dependent methyltransferase [Mycobacterium sp.]
MRIDLTGPPQTMLATLYAKALDADAPHSVLHDQWAKTAVSRIDYDWSRTTITARNAPGVALRSAHFDHWTRQFLAVHDRATVVHLGCGLDARAFRIDPGPDVEWFDVDHPQVIALRKQIYPERAHYTTIAASVTDPDWLTGLPADRPALILGEGLTMYLTEADGLALLRRVVDYFPSGEIQFDAFSRFGIRFQIVNGVVRRSGSTLHWAIEKASDITDTIPGVRALVVEPVFDAHGFDELGAGYRSIARLMSRTPVLRTMSTYHRYAFGQP